MRKLIALGLIASSALTLAACNKEDEKPQDPNPPVEELPGEEEEKDFERTPWESELHYMGFENKNDFGATGSKEMKGDGVLVTDKVVDGTKALKQQSMVNGSDQSAQMGITETPHGRVTWSMMIEGEGEISVEFSVSAGRSFSIHLMPEGFVAYRNEQGQYGDRILTPMAWTPGQYVQCVVEWKTVTDSVTGAESFFYEAFVQAEDGLYKITPKAVPFFPGRGIPTFLRTRTNKPQAASSTQPAFGPVTAYYDQFIVQNAARLAPLEYKTFDEEAIAPVLPSISATNVNAEGAITVTGSTNVGADLYVAAVAKGAEAPTQAEIIAAGNKLTIEEAGGFTHTIAVEDKTADYDVYAVLVNGELASEIRMSAVKGYVDFIAITTLAELAAIKDDLNGTYKLMNDLVGTEEVFETIAGNFRGVLDGQGYTISGLKLVSGLFANVEGTIKDLTLVDATLVENTEFASAVDYHVGLLANTAAYNTGQSATFENVHIINGSMELNTKNSGKSLYAGLLFSRSKNNVTLNNVTVSGQLTSNAVSNTYLGAVIGRQGETVAAVFTANNLVANVKLVENTAPATQKTAAGLFGRSHGTVVLNDAVLKFEIEVDGAAAKAKGYVAAISGIQETGVIELNNVIVTGSYRVIGAAGADSNRNNSLLVANQPSSYAGVTVDGVTRTSIELTNVYTDVTGLGLTKYVQVGEVVAVEAFTQAWFEALEGQFTAFEWNTEKGLPTLKNIIENF